MGAPNVEEIIQSKIDYRLDAIALYEWYITWAVSKGILRTTPKPRGKPTKKLTPMEQTIATLDGTIRRSVKMSFEDPDIPGGFLDVCVGVIEMLHEMLAKAPRLS